MASSSPERAPSHAIVVAGSGDLDVASAPKFRSSIIDALPTEAERGDIVALVLDLSRTDFVDSFGLGVIVGAFKRALRSGLQFGVVAGEGRVRSTLDLVGFPRLFCVGSGVDDVVAAVRSHG